MKVSRRKWHYRWYNRWMNVWDAFGDGGPIKAAKTLIGREKHGRNFEPKSLCTYFWWCVLAGPVSLVALSVVSLVIGVFLLIIVPIMWIKDKIHDRKVRRREEQGLHPKPEKEPSMLTVFVKSRKQKVCPRIELVD